MRRGAVRRALASGACLLLSVIPMAAIGTPNVAHAQPVESESANANNVTLAWPSIGLPKDITFVGANTTQDFVVPVPPGFTATRLRGLIHAPVDFSAGFVEIDDSRGTLLGTVDLPAVTPSQAVVPFDVDVSAAAINGSAVGLSFVVRQAPIPPEQRCGLGERLVMSDLVTVFAGAETAPGAVSTFFPSVLQRLTIYAPVNADRSEQQAVLTLTSAAARKYRSQSTAFTIVNQPRGAAPPPAAQFTRAVVVENGDAAIAVVNPGTPNAYLKLTGRGDQLTDQVSLLVNQLESLVQVPTARVDQAGSNRGADSDELTFGQLNLTGESSVLRTSNLTVGTDRSALGAGRVDGLHVHLLAFHTPVQPMDSASVTVSVNDQAVYTAPLDSSGRVDAVFEVPARLLSQRINFKFDLTFSPRQLCSPTIAPMNFQLDPGSTVTVRRGGRPLGGFSAVPSEFSPEFLVALDGSGPNQLDYAARVVADIARLTDAPLAPRAVDVKAAADATIGALIVANAATLKQTSLRLPIGGESSDVQFGLGSELRADITNGLGSVQVFADDPRDRTVVVATTSGAWSLIEPVLGYIDRLPDGWSGLKGNVAAAGSTGTVSNLSIGPQDSAAPSSDHGIRWSTWVAIGAGCIVLAALGVGAALWWRRRRQTTA